MYNIYGDFKNYLSDYFVQPMNNSICNSPIMNNYNELLLLQQCCNQANIMNNWQSQQFQQMTNCINIEGNKNLASVTKNDKEKEIICNNESISNYMDKEFLYESELKEIEDKFHFKFENLNDSYCDDITEVCKELVDKIKEYNKNFKFILYLYVSPYFNKVNLQTNNNSISIDIYMSESQIKKLKDINDNEKIKNICNMILKSNNPDYQKFYEKYKSRIVKDNEYEDLSYYEKILEENS